MPLSTNGIGDAVAIFITPDHPPGFQPGRKWRRAVLESTLRNLITISDHDFFPSKVKLAHFSVKEYLLLPSNTFFQFIPELSHNFITRSCLTYLLQFDTFDKYTEETSNDFQLGHYAANYWFKHMEYAGADDDMSHLMWTLFQSPGPALKTWCLLWDERYTPFTSNSLYYAFCLGLSCIIRRLLEEGANINTEGGEYTTPLGAASMEGHRRSSYCFLREGRTSTHV